MNLKLTRVILTDRSTIGALTIDGEDECFTLEDRVRPPGAEKVPGKTAIPAGRYEVIISYSQRFKRALPLLLNVPNFQGIRIHPGNTEVDTHGCILVGRTKGPDFIGESRIAFEQLFEKLQKAALKEKIYIKIEDLSAYIPKEKK